MRFNHTLVALAAVLVCGIGAVQPAEADGWRKRGYGKTYYPAYVPARPVVGAYFITDPYAYRYEPRGYYPYYDAGYWRPICGARTVCVPRPFQPPYWKAWGYPKPWRNREFHAIYHGRVAPWHW